MVGALVDVLAALELVGWVRGGVPKVEMVPQMRNMVMAETFSARLEIIQLDNRFIIFP